MNGAEYIESMNDGREVWYDGERVPHVAEHPVLGRCVENRAREYDLHSAPEHHDLLSSETEAGDPCCIMYHIPTSSDDLVRYRSVLELAIGKSGSAVGDHSHFSQEGAMGSLLRLRSLLKGSLRAITPPQYAQNVEAYYQRCRAEDLTNTGAFSEVKEEPGVPTWKQPRYMRVVDETDRGIVVNGIRRISTCVAYSHEINTLTQANVFYADGLSDADAAGDYRGLFFMFAVPVGTPGIKVICRPSQVASHRERFDFPISWYDEVDGMIVFDHVLVPWERVFCYGDRQFLRVVGPSSGLGDYSRCISLISRMELLVGAAHTTARLDGQLGNSSVASQLADLVIALEATKALLRMAEMQPDQGEGGMVLPSRTLLQIALTHGIKLYYDMLLTVRDLAGASVTTHQTYRDLVSPEIGRFVQDCFGGEAAAPERLALLNLVQDLTASHFAARQDQFARFSAGTPASKKLALAQGYDFQPLVAKIQQLIADVSA